MTGSRTARGGFQNEDAVAAKFESWKEDFEAQQWLQYMGSDLEHITEVKATVLRGRDKADIVLKIVQDNILKLQRNVSLKKFNRDADYNQIERGWVDSYKDYWNMPTGVVNSLKKFVGEISPASLYQRGILSMEQFNALRDQRRFFLNELEDHEIRSTIQFFSDWKMVIASDLLRGRKGYKAEWILVTAFDESTNLTEWTIKDIDTAIDLYADGPVGLTDRGSLMIGRIVLQRKGGDGGRDTANMMQFKIHPGELFTI